MANKKAIPPLKPLVAKAIPTGPFHFKGMRFHFAFVAIVVVFSFLIYGNGVPNGYSLDDEFVLHGDSTVQKGIKGIPQLFIKRYAWDQKGTYGYRPVVKASFSVEYQLFGVSPHAGHVVNILIYAALTIFLFYFFRKLLYQQVSDYFLFVVMALFLAHPLHTEVVDSLKNRDAMLSFLLGFFCTYGFVKCFETHNKAMQVIWMVAAMVALNLGILSKPDAILFIAITPLVLYFFSAESWKPAVISFTLMIASVLLRGVLVRHILPHSDYQRTFLYFEDPLLGTHWYQRLQLGFSSLWFYFHKLIFPKDLSCYYGYDEFHAFPKWTDGSVLLGIVTAAVMGWFIYKKKNDRGVWLFSLLLFAGTLFTFLNVIKVGPGIVAERFMFIPSVGFVLIVALALFTVFKIPLKDKLTAGNSINMFLLVGGVLIIYSARVIARNPNWKSHLSIYEHDAKVTPRSAKLQSLLASAYMDDIKKNAKLTPDQISEYYRLAEKAFAASVNIYPQYSTSLNNLGMIEYSYYRNMKKAIEYFSEAVTIDSSYTEALFNMASAYRELNDMPMAEKYFLLTIKSKPTYDMAYIYLSRLYASEGKYDQILEVNENAIKNGHVSDAIYINIGKVYLENGDTTKAIGYFDKALDYFDKNIPLCQFMASYYNGKHDEAKAKQYEIMLENAKAYTQRINQQRN